MPLARLLLRQGVTAHQFAKIAEAAFVAAAEDLLKEQSRQASFSRVSSMTGLHRHAVSSVRAALADGSFEDLAGKEYQRNRLARVLGGWFEHPDFTDRNGRPRPLPLQGPGASFEDLVRRFSGDIYPGVILDELKRIGAVGFDSSGAVHPESRRLPGSSADPEAMEHLGEVARDVLSTLEHNFHAEPASRLFEDSAMSVAFPEASLPMLRRWLERRGAPLLSDLEGWMSEREMAEQGASSGQQGPRVRAGVALTMFVDRSGSGSGGKEAVAHRARVSPSRK